ncbi:CPBP family intramembrane metalloprotease [Xanthomonadaceae bacterium XH05]|nr:CPBP family intramembrane metalloprotease [Xanthomonadaceae bacterium XH05]
MDKIRIRFLISTFAFPMVFSFVMVGLGVLADVFGAREIIYQTVHSVDGESAQFELLKVRVEALDVGDSRVQAISLDNYDQIVEGCDGHLATLDIVFHAKMMDSSIHEPHGALIREAVAAGLGPRCSGLRIRMESPRSVEGRVWLLPLFMAPLALIILLFTWLSRRGRRPFWVNWADWQPRVGTMTALRLGTGYAMVALLVVTGLGAVAYLVGWVPEEPPFLPTLDDWPVLVLASFIAPIFEEFVYRAWLLERISRVMRDSTALLISTCAFAAIHFPASLFEWLNLFLVGLVYGLLWLRTRSMIAVCVAHGLYNGLLLALQILLVG